MAFVKGHGTGNDFVVIPDPEGRLRLSDAQVRWLCDRHVGLGADGILRVVRSAALTSEDVAPADASEVLYSAAARVELAGLQVK